MYEQFRSFYDDVLPEFLAAGEVIQFKVASPHCATLCVCVCVCVCCVVCC